jgi:hypothetical protein
MLLIRTVISVNVLAWPGGLSSMIADIMKEAEEKVRREYDAWKEWSGAERRAYILREALSILEGRDRETFRDRLEVARNVWETKAWAINHDTFPAFLCDVGGQYENAETGEPSGTAYDLANYVSVIWDVLEELGENPVEIATSGWAKARLMVSTIKKNVRLVSPTGEEITGRPGQERFDVKVSDYEPIRDVVTLAKSDVTVRDMRSKIYQPRIPPFPVRAKLNKEGTWEIAADGLTDSQMKLFQRLLGDKISLVLEDATWSRS